MRGQSRSWTASATAKASKLPYDLPLGTRELTAADYVYQIKRLAHPQLHSPIFGLMAEYIVGLKEYAATPEGAGESPGECARSARATLWRASTVVDRYTYRIKLQGQYPQFVYWLAMPFFAPMPLGGGAFYRSPAWRRRTSRSTGGRSAPGPTCCRRTIRTRAWCSSAIRISAARPIRPRANRATPRPACSPMPASRCRSSTRRSSRLEKEEIPLLEQVPAGLLRRCPASARTPSTRPCGSASRARPG